jgi:predicted metal-binding membrane protein
MTRVLDRSSAAVQGGFTARTAAVLAGIIGVASACWVVTIDQPRGMDMGVATSLGSFGFFAGSWLLMMAAMMLPGAIPAVLRRTRASQKLLVAPMFVAEYVAIWAVMGVVVYSLDQPHGTVAAGIVVITAGVYELTPIKRHFRLRCRETTRSGLIFGLDCVGSSVGLMAILVGLGAMSITWMALIAVAVAAQKFLPARAGIDVAVALAMQGLGIVILVAPSLVPGLMASTGRMPMM